MSRFGQRTRVSTQVGKWLPASPTFSPIDLSPTLWLDASDTLTITSSSGKVSQWNDKSGNNYNFVQATSAAQPTTGSSTQNGLNVMSFNGSNYMQLSPVIALTKPVVIVAVAKNNATDSQRTVFHATVDSRLFRTSGGLISIYAGSFLNSATSWSTTTRLVIGEFISTFSRISVNGSAFTTGDAGNSAFNTTFWSIGSLETGIERWNGTIAEIIILNDTHLSSVDKQKLETYLNAKWAVY